MCQQNQLLFFYWTSVLVSHAILKGIRRQFTAHNSLRTIHHSTIYHAQITVHNSLHTIYRAQFTTHNSVCTSHRGTIHHAQFATHNSPRIIHREQFTAQNSSRTIIREKIQIPLDEFLILLDYC
jgi:hypothetical protein